MPIPWTKDLSVGIKEIDDQHQVFLKILNSLYDIIDSKKSAPELSSILDQLNAYTAFHFATEEKYFDKFNYEFSVEHKEEHKKLLSQVNDFNKRFAVEGENVLPELLNFLEDWLVDHLSTQDGKYKECFRKNGLV